MSIKRTIGGNRVGSGDKMQARLHNWYRSTHNLSEKWASSMGSGILYPCCVKLAMRGDRFDINAEAVVRTIPTRKALFGSYKMQIDFYQCPVRLYQALLHNNPLALGLNMPDVKFPITKIYGLATEEERMEYCKINDSALMKYLGLSGVGLAPNQGQSDYITREINAIPMLAYYDIYKTYYANKQEENGVIITPTNVQQENALYRVIGTKENTEVFDYKPYDEDNININTSNILDLFIYGTPTEQTIKENLVFYANNNSHNLDYLIQQNVANIAAINDIYDNNSNTRRTIIGKQITLYLNVNSFLQLYGNEIFYIESYLKTNKYTSEIELKSFPLSNIDDMRYDILSHHQLGVPFVIDEGNHNYLPYSSVIERTPASEGSRIPFNAFPLNGLAIKTYQNDIFNNWLNTEWIEGENGINEISKVQVVDGKFSMDALIFARKKYNMLVRVAIAGATYEDWQDVQYEEVKRKQIETPIFIGGMSQEVIFDEVVQTAPTDGQALGTIGSRGRNSKNTQKGGTFHVKCDEACFIIGIISLTPRIFYTQGNEFYLTDVMTMDDIHKPAMDGLGFQDLIGERMAWWDTKIQQNHIIHRSKVGKLPAWMEYMTSVDKAYGDMAGNYGKGFMILNRNYEFDEETEGIKDATTYVDPSKYNYAFAYNALDAQNFWVECYFNIKARRLMSAKIIPQA